MAIPKKLKELVSRFEEHREAYISGHYGEAQVRQEFINPFFKLLGWDIYNEQGHAEQYKDVVHEDAIKIGGETKAPDYAFRIGGVTKFYLEAKKPSVSVKEDIAPAFQLRRYAWTAKLPLSILTDFEEVAVYDCRVKPVKTDKASTARVMYIEYTEYEKKWDEFASIFSREAVLKGSFDKYAVSTKGKKGTAEVDDALLKDIETWRELLAQNIAIRNPNLNQRELNFLVQRTIDRIIFLRICEDRGIEQYGRILALRNGTDVYPRMCDLFRSADDRYNSGLFHFRKEKERLDPDALSLAINIDDKPLKEIIKGLYYPDSPYEFSVFPADILGHVYEQFLGKVIRLTAGHRAKVEEKPEVRKAGGVYYTPTYIVDYIVKNTVGKLLEDKKPGMKGSASKLRILDPACGSGSFLIGAYQYLLDWHRDQYVADGPQKHKKELFQGQGGDWRLATEEKKRILLNNIYGVDIDPQAVEVTKLSLLLKVLEGQNEQTISKQFMLFHQRALPDLSKNIKCGNSLIGPEIYMGQQELFNDADRFRINAFDWVAEYPDIMRRGGFDAIIGNPPYIRIQTMKEWAPLEVEIYKRLFHAGRTGNYDIYVVFIEQGLKLLNDKGRLGFICPHKFFNSQYGAPLRGIIASGKYLSHVVHFGAQQVFAGATTYTCLLFLNKSSVLECRFVKVDDLAEWQSSQTAIEGPVTASQITNSEWNFAVGAGASLFTKLSAMPHKVGDVADVFVGLQTSADDVYIMNFIGETDRTYRLLSKALAQEWDFEKDLFHPIVSGTDVGRYGHLPNRQYILFPYLIHNERAALMDFASIQRDFPRTGSYLLENKKRLENRENGRMKGTGWHGYIYLKNMARQSLVKLCVPRLVEQLHAAYDHDGSHFLDNVDVGGVTFKAGYVEYGLEYLLALLNSRLMRWYFPQISAPFRGNWRSANRQFLSLLPVRVIDFSDAKDMTVHRRILDLVESMHIRQRQFLAPKSTDQQDVVRRQIDATYAEIDRLIYGLYELTDKEIKIVEMATK